MNVTPHAGPLRREFHVKWKGESYIHCTWEPEEDIAKMYKVGGFGGEGGADGLGWGLRGRVCVRGWGV